MCTLHLSLPLTLSPSHSQSITNSLFLFAYLILYARFLATALCSLCVYIGSTTSVVLAQHKTKCCVSMFTMRECHANALALCATVRFGLWHFLCCAL